MPSGDNPTTKSSNLQMIFVAEPRASYLGPTFRLLYFLMCVFASRRFSSRSTAWGRWPHVERGPRNAVSIARELGSHPTRSLSMAIVVFVYGLPYIDVSHSRAKLANRVIVIEASAVQRRSSWQPYLISDTRNSLKALRKENQRVRLTRLPATHQTMAMQRD